MHLPATAFLSLALCFGAQAQDIFVVGGPGADFADLPEAVLAVSPGDILDVVPGTYNGFSTNKGIHIIGRPGLVTIERPGGTTEPAFGVVGLPAGESFTLRNVTLTSTGIFRNIVRLCEGNVLLDQVDGRWDVDRCANVRMTQCTSVEMFTNLNVVASNLALDRCAISSQQQPVLFAAPAIQASFSKLTIAQCNIGVAQMGQGTGTPAISLVSPCELILTGGPGAIIQAGAGVSTAPIPAVDGLMATAMVDPGTQILGANGGPAFSVGIQVTATSVPTVRVDGAAIGGTAQVQLDGPSGEVYLMAVGLPAPPRQITGFLGEFWLAFQSADSMGVIPSGGQVTTTAMIPNDPALVGLQLSWQSITTFQTEQPRFSNPAAFTIGM